MHVLPTACFIGSFTVSIASAAMQITDVQSGITGVTFPGPPLHDDSGFARQQVGVGTWADLTDGNAGTFTTNFSGVGAVGDLGYLGIRFSTPQNLVSAIEIDIQTFTDGGWYNGGEGFEPTVQITSVDISGWTENTFINNNDNIWTTIGSTTDYNTGVNASTQVQATAAGISNGETFTWNFDTTHDNVTAIRVIGSQGGTASAYQGFLAANEIRAYNSIPEPSTLLLSLMGLVPLLRRKRG